LDQIALQYWKAYRPTLTYARPPRPPPEVNLFSPSQVLDKVLLRMLRHPDVIQEIKFSHDDKRSPHHYVYQRGKAVDFFVLILQVRTHTHTRTPLTIVYWT